MIPTGQCPKGHSIRGEIADSAGHYVWVPIHNWDGTYAASCWEHARFVAECWGDVTNPLSVLTEETRT